VMATAKMWVMATATRVADDEGVRAQQPTTSMVITMSMMTVRMSDCCLQGIQPCECKGEGHRWVGNQVFR
jgi:hypothetical protein